jgi:hypothetical protein
MAAMKIWRQAVNNNESGYIIINENMASMA